MKQIKIRGIVLKTIDFKESSKIVYLYTEYGKISVIAKGAKRKNSKLLPFITTLNIVEATITDSSFPVLIDYSLIDMNKNIKEDLKSELAFLYILELTDKLYEININDRIYKMLIDILSLGNKKENPLLLALLYQVKLLYAFGVNPILRKCSICGNENPKYFSIEAPGAVCINCASSNYFNENILSSIKRLYYFDFNDDIKKLYDIDIKKVFEVINCYYENYVSIKLKGYNTLL